MFLHMISIKLLKNLTNPNWSRGRDCNLSIYLNRLIQFFIKQLLRRVFNNLLFLYILFLILM